MEPRLWLRMGLQIDDSLIIIYHPIILQAYRYLKTHLVYKTLVNV